jgi:hypothetical protein
MARVSVQNLVKGDVIVERVNGKNRMTPVTKVEFNACSTHGVHVNRSMCYEFNAVVNLMDEESTLGDLEKEFTALGDLEEDRAMIDEEFYIELAELFVKTQ